MSIELRGKRSAAKNARAHQRNEVRKHEHVRKEHARVLVTKAQRTLSKEDQSFLKKYKHLTA